MHASHALASRSVKFVYNACVLSPDAALAFSYGVIRGGCMLSGLADGVFAPAFRLDETACLSSLALFITVAFHFVAEPVHVISELSCNSVLCFSGACPL